MHISRCEGGDISALLPDPDGSDREPLTQATVPTAIQATATETRALPPGVGGGDLRLDTLVAAHREARVAHNYTEYVSGGVGHVRSLSVAYRAVGFEDTRRVRYEFTLERFGDVTVDSPRWYGPADRLGTRPSSPPDGSLMSYTKSVQTKLQTGN
jgi:hypothetical protein